MDNEYGDLKDIIVNRDKSVFKITELKLEHFHFNSGEMDSGMPISTSIELTCNYNYEKDKLEWKKIVSHTYVSIDDKEEYTTDSYEEKIEDEIIKKIEAYDLRELKNNYFTEEEPESLSHWEITYNNYFKITGTYDQRVNEFEKISDILDLKKTIEKECKKIQKIITKDFEVEGIE